MGYIITRPMTLRVSHSDNGILVHDTRNLTYGMGDTLEVALVDYARSLIETRDILAIDEAKLADSLRDKLDSLRTLIEEVDDVESTPSSEQQRPSFDMSELHVLIDRLADEIRVLRDELEAHMRMTHVNVRGDDCAMGGSRDIVFGPTSDGGWARAKGVLDLGDEKPEDIVRRMRDGLSPINQGGK